MRKSAGALVAKAVKGRTFQARGNFAKDTVRNVKSFANKHKGNAAAAAGLAVGGVAAHSAMKPVSARGMYNDNASARKEAARRANS